MPYTSRETDRSGWQWGRVMAQQIIVQTYRGNGKYQRSVKSMTTNGWQVVSVTERGPTCFEQFLFGLIFAKTRYTVTYQREKTT